MNHPLRWIFACAVAAVVTASAPSAVAQGGPEFALLKAAGDDAVGYVRVGAPADLLNKIDTVVAPLGISARMVIPALGEKVFHNNAMAGADLSRPWFVVFPAPGAPAAPYAYAIHTSNPSAFFEGIGAGGLRGFRLARTTGSMQVREFARETATFNRDGYLKAVEDGKNPDLESFRTRTAEEFFAGARGQLVFGSSDRDLVVDALKADAMQQPTILDGDIVARFRPDAIAPLLDGFDPGGFIPAAPGAAPMRDLTPLVDRARSALGQFEAVEQALEVGAGRIRLRFAADSRDGTPAAEWIDRQPSQRDDLLDYVPEDCIALWHTSLSIEPGDVDALLALAELISPGADARPASAETRALAGEWAGIATGRMLTFALPNPPGQPGLRVVSVSAVNDAAVARDVCRRMYGGDPAFASIAGFSPGMPGVGAELRTEVAQYEGIPIDRVQFVAPDAVDSDESVRIAWQGIEAIYGAKPSAYFASVPGYTVIAIGSRGLPTLNATLARLVEQRPTRFSTSSRYRGTIGVFPVNSNVRFWVSLGDYMRVVAQALPEGTVMPVDIGSIFGNRPVDLCGYARFSDGVARTEVAIPVAEIITAAQKAVMGAAGGMGSVTGR